MEVVLYVAAGCVVGILVTWLILNSRHRDFLLKKSEELNEIKNRNSVLQANLEAQDKSLDEVKKTMLDTFK
jgi:mannitol-specific phosphotransferase system IIBC component